MIQSPISIIFDTSGNEKGVSGNPVRVDPTGTTTQPISAISLPLPTGAATETTLAGVLTTSAFQARINTLGQKTSTNSTPVVIASDQTAISVVGNAANGAAPSGNPVLTAGSDGSAVRTITTDTSGRSVVVGAAADGASPSGNPVYVAGVDGSNNIQALELRTTDLITGLQALLVRNIPAKKATFTAIAPGVTLGSGKSLLALFCGAGSTNVLKLRRIYLRNAQTTAVTGVVATFELRRITASSVGTAITPVQMDTADAALGANITCTTGGTVTDGALIDRWLWSSDEWGTGTLDQEGADHGLQNQSPIWESGYESERDLTLRATGGVHVKCATATTAGTWDLVFVFTQE